MDRRIAFLATALAAAQTFAQVPAQTPPGSPAPPRPAHSPDPAAGEHSPAGGEANPADARSPPFADPLKQEAVQDPPQPIVAPATRFTTSALLEDMTAIRLARLAQTHTQDAGVRRLARSLVSDRERSDAALGELAQRRSITVPRDLDPDHRSIVQTLGGRRDGAFDRAFLSQISASHDRAIALYTAAAAGVDAELAAFATQRLPRLQAQRDDAKALQAAPGRTKTS